MHGFIPPHVYFSWIYVRTGGGTVVPSMYQLIMCNDQSDKSPTQPI